MPDPGDDTNGAGRRIRSRRRANINRMLALSFMAMLVGYFLAGRLEWLWRDTSGVVHDFEVMNTYARITIPKGAGGSATPAELAALAEQAVREINDLMGPRGERSDVRRLNEAPAGQWVEVNPLTWTVVMESLRWHRLSGGAFDPTIGPLKSLFVFDKAEAASFPDQAALADARRRVGADKLRFDREGMRLSWAVDGMRLDLGAIAKGFAADRAAETLLAHGAANALVDIGGELRIIGHKPGDPPAPWRAGIRNPRNDDILETLEITDAAVATSGDYERYFTYRGKRYEHIIDPRSGLPLTEGVASATVIHPRSCLAADALATTLCVLGPDAGRAFLEEQALGLFNSGVRVIMLTVEKDGALRRHEFRVDDSGCFQAETTRIGDDAPAEAGKTP